MIGHAARVVTGGALTGFVVSWAVVSISLGTYLGTYNRAKRLLGAATTAPMIPGLRVSRRLRSVGWLLVSLAAPWFCVQWSLAWPDFSFNFNIGIDYGKYPLFLTDLLLAACVTWLTICLSASWCAWRKGKTASRLGEGESAS